MIPMDNGDQCCSTHLIFGNGTFNVDGLETFMKDIKFAECGLSYTVVSIMGPQSSGKSTLLNNLFYTNFKEMDTFEGRSQTTKGIWMAKCSGIEPCTLVMDLEGTDGKERGEDDTTFEKQSSLFALAVSDVVLINMWCHDIGREQAACTPLLKTVFHVMMRLFSPRKTTLMFVLRDKTKTPLERLEPALRNDIQKIWDRVPKPDALNETPLSDFFNVEVVALSSYEEKEEQFKEQVACLRQRFFNSIVSGGLAGDRRAVVPASGFSFSAEQIWKTIKENKDLDLPAHKVMVATVRCEEIVNEKFASFVANEEWCQMKEAVKQGPVSDFGKRLSVILSICLSEFGADAVFFDEGVRTAKQKQLENQLLQLVEPTYLSMLRHIRSEILKNFIEAFNNALNLGEGFSAAASDCTQTFIAQFDEKCADIVITQANWNASKMRDKLQRDMESHISSIFAAKLSELTALYKAKLKEALSGPVVHLLKGASEDTWLTIRTLHLRETESAVSGLSKALSAFEIDDAKKEIMLTSLGEYAKLMVEKKAREEAGNVLGSMKDRFLAVFNYDSEAIPRIWTGKEDIRAITKIARSASLRVLSVMAAIRLDYDEDNIEKTLSAALIDAPKGSGSNRSIASFDTLASINWEKVPSSKTLITPVECKSLWMKFQADTTFNISQAVSAQEAHRRNNNRLPPPWVILALIFLGFNEFMLLLRNPLYIAIIFVAYLVCKALWVQLDISSEFRNGTLSALISLASKFLPTVMNMLKKLVEAGQNCGSTGGASTEEEGTNFSSSGSSEVTYTENNTSEEHQKFT